MPLRMLVADRWFAIVARWNGVITIGE